MPTRIAINGFGRIGRLALRAIVESGRDDLEVVGLNSRGPAATAAHLLRYDSSHGRFQGTVTLEGESIDVGLGPIPYTQHETPRDCPWGDAGVDVVLECSGVFTARDDAALHLEAGARRVLVSAPAKDADVTVAYRVNLEALKPDHLVVSAASCTTNCLAPVAKVLCDTCGIEEGYMTTIHSYTLDQPTLDSNHEDLYRARSAATSLIPTKTGAAAAVGLVLPELEGRLDGSAIRVPTPNVSAVDLKVRTKRETSPEEVNAAMKSASEGALRGVLGYTDEKLVSVDFNHDPHSAIVHADQTRVLNGRFLRVLAWYDNEWGFANRMIDLAAAMGAQEAAGRRVA
ncbi:MAG TPA: type I glyceraldehyde-3-phosphate dehydrogenase [Thermohalobaculum sp.]|nr:type I glyceraldehyde-3-phosphate dehydrogenase [Thermohalobaculum sp.]